MLLSKLKNNPSNPRTLSEVDFKKLLNKILVYPRLLEKNKITFDSEQDNTILGGNMRFKTLSHIIKEFANKDISKAIKQAQKSLGVDNKELLNDSIDIFSDVIDSKAVPDSWLQDAKGLTAEEKEAFIIIDNVSDGKWDFDVLANEWELDLGEWNVSSFDIGLDEENNVKDSLQDDYKEPDNIKIDVKLGDLIEIGEHRLFCGDSTDSEQVAKLMNGEKADMVFTDPPYEIDFDYTNTLLYSENCHVFVFNNDRAILRQLKDSPLQFKKFFIFNHSGTAIPQEGGHEVYLDHVLISHEINGKPVVRYNKGNGTRTVIKGEYRKSVNHKHEKPQNLITSIIKGYTNENFVVLDLFLGGGSTMVAAHQLNRKCYGMELEPKYCQIIINRMINLDDTLKVKINGKDYN